VRVAPRIILTDAERRQLTTWSHGRTTPQRLVLRAGIVLRAAQGTENRTIAEEFHTDADTVARWRRRFLVHRLNGIQKDAPRPGRKPRLPSALVDRIVERTLREKPPGATHWSSRTLARAMGVSQSTVVRVWRMYHLKPHRIRTFKLSRDPKFVEKVRDVVGLYLSPPDKAVVLCVDEKTQIQALDRTQTILPIRPGLPESRTHDYRRNGRTDLFAAFNTLDGTVLTACHPRHRHQEFLLFLRAIDEHVPEELGIHIVLDNSSVHKEKSVVRWLRRHPRFHTHFTPTSSSWVNQVERWFDELTDKRIRRGTFKNVPELIRAIEEYVATYQQNPRPFVWTATPEEIFRKVAKNRELLDSAH
jgi:transposase